MADAGRWALIRRPPVGETAAAGTPADIGDARHSSLASADVLEHVATTLLRRYGVVCWQLLEREPSWLPRWRELLRTFHRLEGRGEVRGGRFVNGLSGEQFALPEAIPVLRETRKRPVNGTLVCVSGADPLNLVGTILPGDKIPALAGNRIVFRDGVPIATLISGHFDFLAELSPDERERARGQLTRRV
jgi:ATP-dependent Lhr-like helicase